MKHIHIVGSGPRTGSTLMAEAMIACFNIDRHTAHEDRVFLKAPAGTEVYLTKQIKDILVIQQFLDLDPNLYAICMIRDPRDMIVSRHDKDPDRYWAGLRYWNTYVPYWRRVRSHPRMITIRYEDFVSDPDATQEHLMSRMPFLQRVAPFSRYHEVADPSAKSLMALRGIRQISPAGIGTWRNHRARVAGQIQLHGSIAEDLIEFGYEEDDEWTKGLVGVEPDTAPGHWPEYFTRRNLLRRKLPALPRIIAGRIRATASRERRSSK
jgi:hypothetical protein